MGTTVSTQPLRVMVVDDQPDAVHVLTQLLIRLGCDVKGCESGVQCLLELGRFRPQLLLVDLAMPHMNGFAVAEAVRQSNLQPMPMIVAVTGYGDARTARTCKEAGFDGHELKPIAYERLGDLVSEARLRRA